MPELPEVEVLRRSLNPHLVGQRIEAVEIRDVRLREPLDEAQFRAELPGRTILELGRRAKYLLIGLDGDRSLVVHLGMSGRLTVSSTPEPLEPHEHLTIRLASGKRLKLRDPRRFGLALLIRTSRIAADRHFRHLGLEPLEEAFDGSALRRAAEGRRGPVKTFLMDAHAVAGVGNIYASEALHRAAIHPRRSVARISAKRWNGLADAVRDVLQDAIRAGGTTLNDFADGEGRGGYFQVALAVYERAGEACGRCGGSIRRQVMAGRSTYYCPGCQR